MFAGKFKLIDDGFNWIQLSLLERVPGWRRAATLMPSAGFFFDIMLICDSRSECRESAPAVSKAYCCLKDGLDDCTSENSSAAGVSSSELLLKQGWLSTAGSLVLYPAMIIWLGLSFYCFTLIIGGVRLPLSSDMILFLVAGDFKYFFIISVKI